MGFANYIGDNSTKIDSVEYEKTLRSEDPHFLMKDERVVYAFRGRGGKGRDFYALTSSRLVVRDKKGISGKRVRFLSVPYSAVVTFSIETAGMVDVDQELVLHCRGIGRVSIDFDCNVDSLVMYCFLSNVVLCQKGSTGFDARAFVHDAAVNSGGGGGIFDVLCSDYAQMDPSDVEYKLTSNPKGNLLVDGEKVEMAFKCGRDSFLLTTLRMIKVNVQGMTGSKIEYLTILWPSIKGYSIETAGGFFDRDTELKLYFNIPDRENYAEGYPRNALTRMKIDFHKSTVDLFAVQRYISDKLLGPDTVPPSKHAIGGSGMGPDKGSGSLRAWLGDDNRMVDSAEADRQFHDDIPILQGCEHVELAFRGRRDMLLFTTKRAIFVDVQGFMGIGKKVEYTSLPYTSISAFAVRTAGGRFDNDSELRLWLDFDDVFNPVRSNPDDSQPPPIPRTSCIEIDFQKDKVDVFMLHRYCSERMMRVDAHAMRPYTLPVSPESSKSPEAGQKLLDWIGSNAGAIDAEAANEKLHEAELLQDDEKVALAFKTGRDSLFMTNKRLLVLDVKGISGKRRDYMSVPWDMVRVWAVESAGKFDRDMEVKIWFKGFWENLIDQDMKVGKADIFAIQTFISHFIIGSADNRKALSIAQSFDSTPPGAMTKFFNYGDMEMKDAAALTSQLRSSPILLQSDESIEAAFKGGRDFFLVTTKRIITINTKGISGKSIRYTSYPLKYSKAFMVETAGSFMDGPEFEVYIDDDDIKQELAKGQKDSLWAIHEILSKKMLV
ncbi:hypothetical protein ACHAXA_007578 [Cyclostephanos tholiformis]|uniref:Bacterial Pleckstrin homology domain-containing protein n=1 Tax=Cyclostephanos tholiformis TaxID=382380 RepID=A0ABD3RJS8_9STRA